MQDRLNVPGASGSFLRTMINRLSQWHMPQQAGSSHPTFAGVTMKDVRRSVGSSKEAEAVLISAVDSNHSVNCCAVRGPLALCIAALLAFSGPVLGSDEIQIPPGWEWLLRIMGISSGAESLHEPIVDVKFTSGELFIVRVSDKAKQPVGAEGGYRSLSWSLGE